MKEEIQMIKEELEMCKYGLKHAKIRHYLLWFGSLPLATLMIFMIAAYNLVFLPVIVVLIYAGLARWNIKYHNNLVLDIEDLEYVLEKLSK